MREKLFVDHLYALENGTDDLIVPDEPHFLDGDYTPVGRWVWASGGKREIRG